MIKIKQQLPHGNSWHIQNLWRGKIKQLYCRLFTSYHPNDGSHTPQPSPLFIPLVVRGWGLRGGGVRDGRLRGGGAWERKNINAQSGVASRLHSLALLLSIWDSQWQRDWGLENGSSHHSEQKWTMSWHIHTTPLRLDYGWIVHKLGRWFWQAEENGHYRENTCIVIIYYYETICCSSVSWAQTGAQHQQNLMWF